MAHSYFYYLGIGIYKCLYVVNIVKSSQCYYVHTRYLFGFELLLPFLVKADAKDNKEGTFFWRKFQSSK
jgi:hypothetical protein